MTNIPEAPYNYCDYRCEKCAWTEHCRVYQEEMSERLLLEAEGIDPDTWEGTLEVVHRNFEKVREMLEKDAARFGIDLSGPLEPVPEPPESELEKRAYECGLRLHELGKKISQSDEYLQLQDVLEETYQDFMWNHLLFAVKLKRAMHGFWEYENETDEDFRAASLSDGIKSAGVSIRATETNREALGIFAEKIPLLAEEIQREIRELAEIQEELETVVNTHRK